MKSLLACLLFLAVPLTVRPAERDQSPLEKTVLLTFSGLYNGIDPWTDFTVVHRPLPSTYQPLLGPSPHTNPVDGGDLGIRITWGNAFVSNHGFNANVRDHTGDNRGAHHELGGGVLFSTQVFSMTFSQPVELPSFFWSYYVISTSTPRHGTISVYRQANDTAPAKAFDVDYLEVKSYTWREITAFAGIPVSRIVFDPGANGSGLNIDDITVLLPSSRF